MSNRLANKVCIITGTSGSIGQAAAVAFAREGAIIVGSGQHIGDSEETIKAVAGGTWRSSSRAISAPLAIARRSLISR
jgi:NAD(P)-dependent dehydrogenase (short-subunit alcohol dehydrogenase family)